VRQEAKKQGQRRGQGGKEGEGEKSEKEQKPSLPRCAVGAEEKSELETPHEHETEFRKEKDS